MPEDFQLLREYVENASEEAFRTLVERHARMVYSTALRVTGDGAFAQEVTQATFILLSRKAARLTERTLIAGWLYRTARFVALQAVRTEQRRRRNQETYSQMNDAAGSAWEKVVPLMEDAIHRLGEADRNAVVLRFLEQKSFAEVAAAMGTTEGAAKMRVGRALEKLRELFAAEGVVLSAAALTSAFVSEASLAPPAGLISSVSAAALGPQLTAASSLTNMVTGALKIMTWNKIRTTLVAAGLALLMGGGATFLFLKGDSTPPPILISTFEPMAGEWEGTFTMSGDGFTEPMVQNAALTIRSLANGRSCQIEMRVLRPKGGAGQVFRFTHSLNERGDRIITLDDPNIARPLGEGAVTESRHDANAGLWRAGFHAEMPNQGGATDCHWSRTADQLSIVRRDRTVTPQGVGEVTSELRLRRTGSAQL